MCSLLYYILVVIIFRNINLPALSAHICGIVSASNICFLRGSESRIPNPESVESRIQNPKGTYREHSKIQERFEGS